VTRHAPERQLSDRAAAEFRGIYERWGRAVEAGDRDWLEERFTDDFVYLAFSSDGEAPPVRLDKEGFVAGPERDGEPPASVAAVEATVVGDVAVTWMSDARRACFASAWRRERAGWRCFSHQLVGVHP
jgi:Domain of unknown function (DUF4440)